MTEEQIITTLTEACQDDTLCFQIIIQDNILHIYINRENRDLDYHQLTDKIYSTVISQWADFTTICLYSRLFGQLEPDWQTVIEVESKDLNSKEIGSSVVEAESEAAETKEELNDDTSDHTQVESELDLTKYCFIRNRKLLTAELVCPKINIAKLVRTFHQFEKNIKQSQLPIIENYFKEAKNIELSNFDAEVQSWWSEVQELSPEANRKLAIWLSRYCYDSEATLETIEKVFAAQAAIVEAQEKELENQTQSLENQPASDSTPDTYIPYTQHQPRYKPTTQKRPQKSRKVKSQPINLKVTLPIIWAIVTLLILIININSAVTSSTEIPAICQDSTESDYCHLAAQIVGEKALSEAAENAVAFQPETLEMGLESCQFYGNIAAGIPIKQASSQDNPLLFVSGAEILSGIYVGDVEQTSTKGESIPIRTACVFQQTDSKILQNSIQFLSIDQIDPAWPEVAYEPSEKIKTLHSLNKTLTTYSLLGQFGLSTFFSVVVIYILALLGMAIQVNSLEAIYQASFILGIVESILAVLPIPGLLMKVPLECIALGITGACVKGFKVDWSVGYPFVAATAVLLIVFRWLFCWLTLAILFNIFG